VHSNGKSGAATPPFDILHVLPHVRRSGNGIVNAAVDLAVEQASRGYSVGVVSAGGEWESLLQASDVTHVEMPINDWRSAPSMVRLHRRLSGLLRASRPRIIHTHTLSSLLLVSSVSPRNVVHTLHNPWQRGAAIGRMLPRRSILLSEGGRKLSKRERIVANGVVGSRRYASTGGAVKLSKPSVVTVGGLYKRKGVQDLIRALPLTRGEWTLYVLGEGPYRPDLEAITRDVGQEDHVQFAGFVADPLPWIAEADVFALVSHSEGGALVFTEARMLGAPIIYTDVGDVASMMEPNAGRSVPVGDAEAVAVALDDLEAHPERLAELARLSREGLERYSVSRVTDEVLAVYGEVSRDIGKGRRVR
jgi:glycosyltransferase involved in cell wall biosynthesis